MDSLPAELAHVLADAGDVFLAAAFDRGDRETAERQIRGVLRVAGRMVSHVTSSILFNWAGRRDLLGGLAALEDMLSLDGGRLPPLLSLLAARERQYIAELKRAAAPVGRHATGGGRSTARDPLSFGFEGSFVLDEDAHRALQAPAAAAAAEAAPEPAGGWSLLSPRLPPLLSWGASPAEQGGKARNIYVEEDVPVSALFEAHGSAERGGVGPSYQVRARVRVRASQG